MADIVMIPGCSQVIGDRAALLSELKTAEYQCTEMEKMVSTAGFGSGIESEAESLPNALTAAGTPPAEIGAVLQAGSAVHKEISADNGQISRYRSIIVDYKQEEATRRKQIIVALVIIAIIAFIAYRNFGM